MACSVREAPAVARELDRALAYLELELSSEGAASRLAKAYIELVDRLERHPLMYPLCLDKRLSERGYRKAVLSGTSYLVLYSVSGETVTIAHVFHQRSDYARFV